MSIESPSKLELKGKPSGIIRLSKNIKIAAILIVMLVISLIAYGISSTHHKKQAIRQNEQAANTKLEAATEIAKNFSKDIPDSVNTKLPVKEEVIPENWQPQTTSSQVNAPKLETSPEEELKKKIKEQQLQDALRARTASTTPDIFINTMDREQTQQPVASRASSDNSPNLFEGYKQLAEYQAARDDQSKQIRKEKFLKEAALSNEDNYLHALKKNPISPYEIKAGHIIPAAMVSGINSDLPGQIIAQVRENVYDTANGEYLLIPQGTRLVGTYDSQIAYGQERVLIAWNRLIFPDSSSLDLKAMPGSDIAGYAGFTDKVDHHYFRTFGSAVLMSVISAGAQLSQPQVSNNTNQAPSTGQTVAASLGSQLSQTGNTLLQKNLNIQPTLKIRPGYLFNVMVNKDLVLPGIYK
jgi:type IV secretion system protein VirB10